MDQATLLRRVDVLEEENARLRARIANLEGVLGAAFVPPIEFRLSGSEGAVLGCLVARSFASKEAIMATLYRDNGKDEAELKIVDVFICKLRKKLRPWGVEISTVWGQGYQLAPEWRQRLAGNDRRAA